MTAAYRKPRILIRADDLGYSEGVNHGIAKSVRDGMIRTVGVMPNMPAAAHGLALLASVKVCLGQHTNICVGYPLTDPKYIPSLVQENGQFKPSRVYRMTDRDFVVLDEVILEIEAQYQRFVELTGRQPSYFEGHAVKSANFNRGLEIVAARHGLDYLPLRLDGPVLFRKTWLYAVLDSMKSDYDPFASLQKAALADHGSDGCSMLICHPGYLDDPLLQTSSLTLPRTKEVAMACAPSTRQWLAENGVQLVTFDDL